MIYIKDVLYSRQMSYIIFIYLLGSAFIYVPESFIGRDAWLSTILASLPGLYILYIIIYLQEAYTGKSIMEVTEIVCGKIIGKILNSIFLWVILWTAILLVMDQIRFMSVIYPQVSEILITTFVLLAVYYIINLGITVTGRLVDIYIWLILIFVIIGLGIAFSLFNINNLRPILVDLKPVIGASIYGANWPFAEVSLLALLFPYVIDLKEKKIQIYKWFFFASLVLIIRTILTVGVLGSEYLKYSNFPLYDVFRLIQISDFQRIELFFFFLFFSITAGSIILSQHALILATKQLFNLNNTKLLMFPIGLLTLVFMFYIFPSEILFYIEQARSIVFITLPIHILYPTIVLVMTKLKQGKTKPQPAQNEI